MRPLWSQLFISGQRLPFVNSIRTFTTSSFERMAIRPAPEALAAQVASTIHQPRDPNTLANYNAWRTKHTTANFEIDFDAKRLQGNVVLTLQKLAEESKIILDTSHLDIDHVEVGGHKAEWNLATNRVGPYGTPLTINLESKHQTSAHSEFTVSIGVKTTKDCTALQWLTKAQTSNKKFPYMFSQCQAIHARSLFPCQDTPDVKSTYTFNIRSPLPVVASGLPTGAKDFKPGNGEKSGTLLYTFHQAVPMPSYLFALASGDLASASIGPRSTVWTGPEELLGCQWEFERDMEPYMQAIEKIVYPYAWTTYNLLILPPSFPYGGMENPVVSFITPSVVSRDRQNVDVVAHELSHSWSGNLVSCGSWEHFWLNEGWTTYLERRLQAVLHGGDEHRDFSAIIGWKALADSVDQFGADHEFTKMIPDLKGKDPDDAFSSVPYEKGFTFLYYLEKLVGKNAWDSFIPHYFTVFKNKSLDSYEFKATLLDFYKDNAEISKKLNDIDWDSWFYKPGLPPRPDFDTTLADACLELANKWQALSEGKSDFKPVAEDISQFSAQQVYVFLEGVQAFPSPLSPELVDLMGKTYDFSQSYNIEIVSRYYVIGLKARDKAIYKPTADLLGTIGRMKFVRPLFRGLMECDMKLAKETLEKNKDFYHPICRNMMEKLYEKAVKGQEA